MTNPARFGCAATFRCCMTRKRSAPFHTRPRFRPWMTSGERPAAMNGEDYGTAKKKRQTNDAPSSFNTSLDTVAERETAARSNAAPCTAFDEMRIFSAAVFLGISPALIRLQEPLILSLVAALNALRRCAWQDRQQRQSACSRHAPRPRLSRGTGAKLAMSCNPI